MMTMRDFFRMDRLRKAFPHHTKRLALAQSYQTVFGSDEGQIVLRDLIAHAGLLTAQHDPGDPRFADGKQALALHILERLRWSVSELQLLQQEISHDALLDREAQLADAASAGGYQMGVAA